MNNDEMEFSIKEKIENIKNADINAMRASLYEDALDEANRRARNNGRLAVGLGVFGVLSNVGWFVKSALTFGKYKKRCEKLDEILSELEEERE